MLKRILLFCLTIIMIITSFYLHDDSRIIISILLGLALLYITVIDLEHFIIPDIISLPLIPIGIGTTWYLTSYNYALEHSIAAFIGVAVLYAIRWVYQKYREKEGLGLGDVKLAGAAGAWTGLAGLNQVILLACILALTFIIFAQLSGKIKIKGTTAIPFGTCLAPAIWMIWSLQMSFII